MKKALYLGTDPTRYKIDKPLIHHPVIKIMPRSFTEQELAAVTLLLQKTSHVILTSRNAVELFWGLMHQCEDISSTIFSKLFYSVGPATTEALLQRGSIQVETASTHTQEGVVALLEQQDHTGSYFLLPRASMVRDVLTKHLEKHNLSYAVLTLYDTIVAYDLPPYSEEEVDEIIFTSPSTVKAFFTLYGKPRPGVELTAIGPVTRQTLKDFAVFC
jgi:uroporphyrinogen-III synthase